MTGKRLCLDFANTAEWHASNHPMESLRSYEDLATWGLHAGIITDEEWDILSTLAAEDRDRAQAVLARAIQLREAIYGIFSAHAGGRPADGADLSVLNSRLTEALAQLRIMPRGPGFAWVWEGIARSPESVLWPVARSAAELLASGELDRVRECPGEGGCGWLFLDTSRNRSRKWCEMKSCGNRAKAKRHYQSKIHH